MFKKIIFSLVAFIIILNLTFCGGGKNIKEDDLSNKAKSSRGQATGYATIFDQDASLARDRALDDAKNKLVVKILGETISGSSLVKDYELVSSIIEARSYGLVKDIEVLKEWQKKKEIFVTIEGTVDTAEVEEAIEETIERYGRPKFMVLIEETFEDKKNLPGFTETEIIMQEIMAEAGFEFVDAITTKELMGKEKKKMKKIMKGNVNSQDVQDLLLEDLGAEIIITGTAQTKDQSKALRAYGAKNMQSKSAIIRVKAIDVYTGRIFSSISRQAPGVHIEADTASKKAIGNALKKILGKTDQNSGIFTPGKFMEKIIAKFVKATTSRQIDILLTGLNYKEVKKFKNTLNLRIRGVKKVLSKKQKGKAVRLEVYFAGKTNDLADELLAKSENLGYNIEIKEIFPNRIILVVQKIKDSL